MCPCGSVVVCPASKGHGRNILLILCVRVAVCHASKDHGRNSVLILCVSVAVCHASKGHGRNIILILCAHVAVRWCVMLQEDMVEILLILCVHVAVCHASKGHGRNIPLILCVCVVVCHASKGYDSNILLTLIVFLLCDSLNDSSYFFAFFSTFPKLFTVTFNSLNETLSLSFPLFQNSSLIVPISLLLLLQSFRAYFMLYTVWQASR